MVKLFGVNYGDWAADSAVELTYDKSTGEYTYTETTPANLAGEFKLSIDGNIHYSTAAYRNAALSTTSDFQELSDVSNMVLTGCEGFVSATLTVKKSGDKWMLKIVGDNGVETHNVQLRGASYSWYDDAPAFTYDAENDQYIYEEATTNKLAQGFKVTVDGSWYRADVALPTTDFTALYAGDNMTLSGAADYSKITLTVKKIDGAWNIKVAGEKGETPVETVVKIKGEFNGWKLTELEGADGIYTITVTENLAQLADGFGFEIDGVYYAGDIELELDGDAVVMTANPDHKNVKLANEGKYDIILTVAKVGSNWTVQAAKGNPSAVEAINAENVSVLAGNGEIVVDGAQSVAVYTAAGALVSTDARTRVAAGLYIVRADNVVKKVLVK